MKIHQSTFRWAALPGTDDAGGSIPGSTDFENTTINL
jgi:hypothetical protein